MEEIKELAEELEKVRKTWEHFRDKQHMNWQEIDKLEKKYPSVSRKIAIQIDEEKIIEENIKKLEKENEDIDMFILPPLEGKERKLRGKIKDLKREKEMMESFLEKYKDRKKRYVKTYKEAKETEEKGKEIGIKHQRTSLTAIKIEENKLKYLARILGKQEDCNKFLKLVEKKYGKLEKKLGFISLLMKKFLILTLL